MAAQLPTQRRALLIEPPDDWLNNIPSTDLGANDTRSEDQRRYARAAYFLWLNDLEHIRRPKPLLASKNVTVLDINLHSSLRPRKTTTKVVDLTDDGADAYTSPPATTKGARARGSGSQRQPVDLIDTIEPHDFYKKGATPIAEARLQYQQRTKHLGQIPGPGALRLDMNRLLAAIGNTTWVTQAQIANITREQLFGTVQSRPRTFEDALQQFWLDDTAVGVGGRLLRGFPMMEDVVFLRAGNYGGNPSDCFWKAVAYQVYGDQEYSVRVKAEHLKYFSEVLRWPQHPKHELYTRMNTTFHSVDVASTKSAAIAANLFQLMTIPCSYQPIDMFEITADLYNLFITVYGIAKANNKNPPVRNLTVANVTMRGPYNAKHVFFLYLDGTAHYQPLVPNEFIASEFRLPRPSWETTYGYPNINLRVQDTPSAQHAWRRETSEGNAVDRTLGLPPATPHCDEYWINAVINGDETDVIRG